MNLAQAREQFGGIRERMRAYQYALSIANWDTATLAPPKGKAGAAKAMGILAGEAFSLKTSPEMKAVLDTFAREREALTPVEAREAELLREEIEKLERIPKAEYQEFTELQSVSQFVWEEAKEASDFDKFAPYLEKVVGFVRRFAGLTHPGLHPYDACLDDYEKGLTREELDPFFASLREKAAPLVERIAREGRPVREDFLSRSFPVGLQEELSRRLLGIVGFDLEGGVLAASEHPFTSEITAGDVRLTTHFYETNMASAMLSTVHEAGHGLYEQNAQASPLVGGSLLDSGVSMGIHESQSRFYENMIFRSRSFVEYLFPLLRETYPQQLGDVSAEEFYRAVNIARPGLIRIEADELTYNLHIMVRYELERMLLEETAQAADLPRLWNEMYDNYLGIQPECHRDGVLQDVHWSGGMIGYFPSYALGNAYAAQIRAAMLESLDLDGLCRKGDLAPVAAWLNREIHQYGMLKTPGQLLRDVTGKSLDPSCLTDYLEEKFTEVYF